MQPEFELILSNFLNTPWNTSYFWNLMALAAGDLKNYKGPKSLDEFLDGVKNRKYHARVSQSEDKTLLDLYLNIKSPDVQKCMTWVGLLTPLVAHPDILRGILQKTHLTELDCYNTIVLNHKLLQDTKLQYDLLTRVIDKIQPIAETNRIHAEPYKKLYNVARFFRASCEFAKTSSDARVRETLVGDKLYNLRNHQTASGKLEMTRGIMDLMMQKLEHTIKTTAPQNQAVAIRAVCQEAYQYVAYAGAENQDFVNKIWDVFNWRDIVNVPAIAAKELKR